jgi:hypothetical protein
MAVIKGEAKTGFWVAIGVLSALTLWHLLSTRFPAIQTGRLG